MRRRVPHQHHVHGPSIRAERQRPRAAMHGRLTPEHPRLSCPALPCSAPTTDSPASPPFHLAGSHSLRTPAARWSLNGMAPPRPNSTSPPAGRASTSCASPPRVRAGRQRGGTVSVGGTMGRPHAAGRGTAQACAAAMRRPHGMQRTLPVRCAHGGGGGAGGRGRGVVCHARGLVLAGHCATPKA